MHTPVLKTKKPLSSHYVFQRETNDIRRRCVITWHVNNSRRQSHVSCLGGGELHFTAGAAWRRCEQDRSHLSQGGGHRMRMLASLATFVQSQTVPSAVKSFIDTWRRKVWTLWDRGVAVSRHTEAPARHLSSSVIQTARLQVGD